MKKTDKILRTIRKCGGEIINSGEDGFACVIPRAEYYLCIVCSWGKNWEHVSIHAEINKEQQFCPFWEDMCYIKHSFFKDSETVIQYHPPRKCYVNNHPHVLHLWRPQKWEIVLPPIWMV